MREGQRRVCSLDTPIWWAAVCLLPDPSVREERQACGQRENSPDAVLRENLDAHCPLGSASWRAYSESRRTGSFGSKAEDGDT